MASSRSHSCFLIYDVLVALRRLKRLRSCSIGGRHPLGQLRRAGRCLDAGVPVPIAAALCPVDQSQTTGRIAQQAPPEQYVLGEVRAHSG